MQSGISSLITATLPSTIETIPTPSSSSTPSTPTSSTEIISTTFHQHLKDKVRLSLRNRSADHANVRRSRSSSYGNHTRNSGWGHYNQHNHRQPRHSYQTYGENFHSHQQYFRRKKRTFCCVNCGKEGHIYKQCTEPITSFGIIAIKKGKSLPIDNRVDTIDRYKCSKHLDNTPDDTNEALQQGISKDDLFYLMVQRKDTMGFIDFIRGKYPEDASTERKEKILCTYLEEMTCEERRQLSCETFEDLWDLLWINKLSMLYINEYVEAKRKFEKLSVKDLLLLTECKWTEQEYGFPKGRKNMYETNLECAKREFKEESGYTSDQYKIVSDRPWEEIFVGTNGVTYRHVYYIAEISPHATPKIPLEDVKLAGEISNIGWFTYNQCMTLIRPYDQAKKDLLTRVHRKFTADNH